MAIRTSIRRAKPIIPTRGACASVAHVRTAQPDVNNCQSRNCEPSAGRFTGTGIRTPVPWLRIGPNSVVNFWSYLFYLGFLDQPCGGFPSPWAF
jgi:hypothetical protein